jgi:Cohesin domain
MSRKRIVQLVLFASIALLAVAPVAGCGTGGGGLSVPIKIENADHVGAISLNLLYDSTVLEVTAVNLGAPARGGDGAWQITGLGTLKVVVKDANINGAGTLATVKCKALNTTGSSTLVIQVLGAIGADSGEDVETQVIEGSYSAADDSVEAPVISFGA